MKRYIFALLLCLPLAAGAEQLFNAETTPFEMRQDSESRVRQKSEYYVEFSPNVTFTRPDKWADRVIWLHLENVGSPYLLTINGSVVLQNSDPLTPTNIDVTKHLREGENQIEVTEIEPSIISTQKPVAQTPFEGSYLIAQPYTHIHDFNISLTPTAVAGDARLDISVTLRNDFTTQQSVDVGFDIYSPEGKLLDFSVNNFSVEAGQEMEVTFSPTIYNTTQYRWSPESPKRYEVTIYTRRNGVITEYIPQSVPFVDVEYRDNKLYNFGRELKLNIESYNSATTKQQSHKELLELKSKGVNTLSPSYPQPRWFYELCTEVGMWIIEQPNINSQHESLNKKVGGTPANDPSLVEEYIRRGKASYYRSRGFDNILCYSLGGSESGNGYNMYKLYEWIKSVETSKPVIYKGVTREWNSDTLE